jgi:phytanoyl-CoA hydroxylase
MHTTTAPSASTIPEVDGSRQDGLTEAQAEAFREYGALVIRDAVCGAELASLQAETLALVERARAGWEDRDVLYGTHPETGERVPCRIDYVVQRGAACKALLAHPLILRAVERLQGRGFIPTWDALVFKNEGAGLPVGWHVDAASDCTEADTDGRQEHPIFNVDLYLDRADRSNCVWAIPGSNRWSHARRLALCDAMRDEGGFRIPAEAVPIPMEPGDLLLHDICVLHGSPATRGPLRRVIYYEYRPCDLEFRLGPHRPEYIPVKQRIMRACLRDRATMPYAAGERPYMYAPEAPFVAPELTPGETPPSYRVPHDEFWRR